jgi:hypothetical protein
MSQAEPPETVRGKPNEALFILGWVIAVPAAIFFVGSVPEDRAAFDDVVISALALASGFLIIVAAFTIAKRIPPRGSLPSQIEGRPGPARSADSHSQSEPHAGSSPPRWTAIRFTVFAIGLLIIATSGLCTVIVGFPLLDNGPLYRQAILVLGGIPVVFAAALVAAGLTMRPRD